MRVFWTVALMVPVLMFGCGAKEKSAESLFKEKHKNTFAKWQECVDEVSGMISSFSKLIDLFEDTEYENEFFYCNSEMAVTADTVSFFFVQEEDECVLGEPGCFRSCIPKYLNYLMLGGRDSSKYAFYTDPYEGAYQQAKDDLGICRDNQAEIKKIMDRAIEIIESEMIKKGGEQNG